MTTISDGCFLKAYGDEIDRSGWRENIRVIVIPDRRTSPLLFENCNELRKRGVEVACPTLEDQETYLARLGIPNFLLYDSDHRRNLGFLLALENESDFIISIDDDNICRDHGNFIDEHAVVCRGEQEFTAIQCANGWFNICELMDVQPQNVYPRGFPYRFRQKPTQIRQSLECGEVHLNAGLWLREPDLDAITWLANPAQALSFHGQSVLLSQDTWSPINTQNTAINQRAIVAFYFVRMGYPIAGMRIDRYGDIFSGYFCQACVRHLGYRIRVGTPIVDHVRNRHNYLLDLTYELACIWLIEDLTEWLLDLRLEGHNYAEAYLSLADALDDGVEKFSGFIWNESSRGYFHHMARDMRTWVNAVRTITG